MQFLRIPSLIALKFKLYLLNNFYFGIIFSRIMNTNNRKKYTQFWVIVYRFAGFFKKHLF